MKVACVYIDHFAAAVEFREHPEFRSQPIVIGGFPSERKPVFACSSDATQSGIAPGMQLSQAQQLCPNAIFIPLDESKYIRAFEEVLDILDEFSPAVEAGCLGKVFLDVTGMGGLFGTEGEIAQRITLEIFHRAHLDPRIGIASNKFVATAAANMASSRCPYIIKTGEEREFLGPLPAHLLPVSENTKRRFDLLGLRTICQIAALPQDAMADQFGEEGILARELANGKDEQPLFPRIKPVILEQELSSETPLETIDVLMVAVGELLNRLIPKLRNKNQVCGQIKLCFHLDGEDSCHEILNLKIPTDSKLEIMSLLKHFLETARFPAGITGICLGLTQLGGEEGKQGPLFSGERTKQEERLKRVVKRFQAKFGKNPLRKVLQVDPDSRIPERRYALSDCEPWLKGLL